MGFKERLKQLIDNKEVNGKKLTPYRIGKLTSIATQSIDNYLSGKQIPSVEKVRILAEFLNVSVDWLLNGEESNAEPSKVQEFIEVPLVKQYAYAGYLSGYADEEYVDSLPTATFVIDRPVHGKYISFDVKGDSMDDGTTDSYMEGDRVLCREVQMNLWAESKIHLKKWDFVIVCKEGVLLKRIINHDVENKTITIHSLNPMYPDKNISLCDVRQILNVVQQMRPRKR